MGKQSRGSWQLYLSLGAPSPPRLPPSRTHALTLIQSPPVEDGADLLLPFNLWNKIVRVVLPGDIFSFAAVLWAGLWRGPHDGRWGWPRSTSQQRTVTLTLNSSKHHMWAPGRLTPRLTALLATYVEEPAKPFLGRKCEIIYASCFKQQRTNILVFKFNLWTVESEKFPNINHDLTHLR